MIQTKPITLALYFGNRGFFPAEVLESARAEMTRAVEEAGCRPLLMDASLTRYGGVETVDEGLKYAAFLKEHEGEVDYIHGDDVTRELGAKPGNMGFLLPAMGKEQLFKTVMADGVLPRKTFSMGHAQDKRYYVEARKIK